MKLIYAPAAKLDLQGIADWIGEDDASAALKLLDRLEDACRKISERPRAYALMKRFAHEGLRQKVVGRYLVIYRVVDHIEVVRIVHGARDVDALLNDEAD